MGLYTQLKDFPAALAASMAETDIAYVNVAGVDSKITIADLRLLLGVVNVPLILTSITVTPATGNIPAGNTQQYTAIGLDQNGTPLVVQPAITWSTNNGSITAGGLLTAGVVAIGRTVTATAGAITGTATFNSTQVLTTITVTPNPASVTSGGIQQFTATSFDQLANALAVAPTYAWSTNNGSITAGGLLTAGAVATGRTVTATSGAFSGTATFDSVASSVARVVFQGDSIASGYWAATATDHAISSMLDIAASNISLLAVNNATAGRRINGQPIGAPLPLTDATVVAAVDALYDASRSKNIYCVSLGVNDLYDLVRGDGYASGSNVAAIVASLKSHMQGRKAVGFTTVLALPPWHPSAAANIVAFIAAIEADTTIADYFMPLYYEIAFSDAGNYAQPEFYQSDNSHPSVNGHSILSKIATPILVSALAGSTRPAWAIQNLVDLQNLGPPSLAYNWITVRADGKAGDSSNPTVTANNYVIGSQFVPPSGQFVATEVMLKANFAAAIPDTATVIYAGFGVKGKSADFAIFDTDLKTLSVRSYDWGAAAGAADWIPGANIAALPLMFSRAISLGIIDAGYSYFLPDAGALAQISKTTYTAMVFYNTDVESATDPTGRNQVSMQNLSDTYPPKMMVIWQPV